MKLKATGLWQGSYWFDPIPDSPENIVPFGFGMLLKQSWLFGSLVGEIWDDPPHGMPGRGKIDGKVSGVEMHFIKRMPVHYVFHLVQNRMMTLQEQMRLDEGIELDEPVPHPLLRYTGVYNAVADELTGTWEFETRIQHVVSRGQSMTLDVPQYTGRWVARRSHSD